MFTTIVIDAFAAENDPERFEKAYEAGRRVNVPSGKTGGNTYAHGAFAETMWKRQGLCHCVETSWSRPFGSFQEGVSQGAMCAELRIDLRLRQIHLASSR